MDPFIARNLTFGIEDSLISTTGVLVGIAAANFEARHIVATGLVLIVAEAFSMAYGAFLSEENFIRSEGKRRAPLRETALYGAVMFASYFAVGLVLLAPYALRVYESSVTPEAVFTAYAAELPRAGWKADPDVAKETPDTRAFARGETDLLVTAQAQEGKTLVSIVEMGGR